MWVCCAFGCGGVVRLDVVVDVHVGSGWNMVWLLRYGLTRLPSCAMK